MSVARCTAVTCCAVRMNTGCEREKGEGEGRGRGGREKEAGKKENIKKYNEYISSDSRTTHGRAGHVQDDTSPRHEFNFIRNVLNIVEGC